MSEIPNLSSNGKTGIRTSTFYNQTKLNTFPKDVKTRSLPLHPKEPLNQSTDKGTKSRKKQAQKLKRKRTKKLPMFKNSSCEKEQKFTGLKNVSDFEEHGDQESDGVADLRTGKRTLAEMGSEGMEQTSNCKKIRLDLNKNLEETEEFSNQNEFFAATEAEKQLGEQGGEIVSETETLNSVDENGLCTHSESMQSDNTTVNDGVKYRKIFDQCRERNRYKFDILSDLADEKQSEDEIFGNPSSVSQCETGLTIDKRTNLSGENDEVLGEELKNQVLDSPISITQSGSSLEQNGQNDTESKSSQQTNDNTLNGDMNLVDSPSEDDFSDENKTNGITKKTENDKLGPQNSSCHSKNCCKTTSSVDRKRLVSRKKNGSLDAFVIVEKSRKSKTNDGLKDSGFHEPFRILGELSSQEGIDFSSAESSPLLFSSNNSSTGCSGLLKSKSVSPESQSSITKYFTPLRKSGSSVSSKGSNLSPILDKKGRRIGRGRQVMF